MARCVFWFTDKEDFVNIEAEKLYEENGNLYAFKQNHLVGMFKTDFVKVAYISENKK